MNGNVEAMPHWAGESLGKVESLKPAAAIIKEIADEAEMLLSRWTESKAR
jgi:hypothetical protein